MTKLHAIPPGAQPTKENNFVSELDLSPSQLRAAIGAGQLLFWRTDAAGVRFYRRVSALKINAVPEAIEVDHDTE